MNVSLTPELEQLVNDKLATGLYQTASEVVREALRLLKERDQEREDLRAEVRAGLDAASQGRSKSYDTPSGRRLRDRIKMDGRTKPKTRR